MKRADKSVFSRKVFATVIVLIVFAAVPYYLSLNNTLIVEGVIVSALFALATNFLVRSAGLISFGQAVFYGIGAYTVGLFWAHTHVPFMLTFVLAPFIAAFAALVIGLLSLRARAFYFALLTMGFSQLFYSLTIQFYGFTEGDTGIFGVALPKFLNSPVSDYEFIFLLGVVGTFALWWVRRTPFGLTLTAIRDNRMRAQSTGVNVFLHQLTAFIISGFFCGLAGAMFILYQQHAYPEMLNWETSGTPILMSVLGGIESFVGPIVGAFIYNILETWLGALTQYWQLVIGMVILIFILAYPGGVTYGISRIWTRWRAKNRGNPHDQGTPVASE